MYFELFCKFYKISAFFVSDTVLISKNITKISNLCIPIISFLDYKENVTVDYSFFFNIKGNDYYYLLSSMFLNYAFFLSLNYKFNCFKFLYLKKINMFMDCIHEPNLYL